MTEVTVFRLIFARNFGICLIFRGGHHLQKAINVSLAFDDFSGLGGVQFLAALAGKAGRWAFARRSQI